MKGSKTDKLQMEGSKRGKQTTDGRAKTDYRWEGQKQTADGRAKYRLQMEEPKTDYTWKGQKQTNYR